MNLTLNRNEKLIIVSAQLIDWSNYDWSKEVKNIKPPNMIDFASTWVKAKSMKEWKVESHM